uniref:Uncharacterized protein n=1 Tax=viral metagenome TaxID=1070528 RepID=A0A6M3J9H6_9ZZZZ
MKSWKTIVVLLLVAVAGCTSVMTDEALKIEQEKKAMSVLQTRISQLEVLKAEKSLTRDIMQVQLEIAELSKKAEVPK